MGVAAVVALAVLAGAMAQRVSGMGFALVVAPVLVLLVGPVDGVLMVNICGATSACLIITRVWSLIDWRQYLLLVVPALVAVVPGALVAARLGGPLLQIVIGLLVVVALTVSLLVTRAERVTARLPTGIITGAASGFMSATAGVSGPSAGIYAVLTRWEHREFAATIQPFFATLGAAAFLSKIVALPDGLPDYDWWLWPLILGCTVVGLVAGERLARVVSARAARRSVVVLAYAGGVVAMVDGAWELMR